MRKRVVILVDVSAVARGPRTAKIDWQQAELYCPACGFTVQPIKRHG